ncbi:unnamed protein product [Acanthoscelides obtectus]|uniref:Uncharacterized protein n=1 Tax=Acanthoscelides obtectus TaxID=200917 RepID=A0A9P0LIC3_ACAOB|nr:unnamed protein product [Acanthoscelides obtectus]CAH1992853.1 unnamed protein product [Acanthoscelides obtectus]CAK1669565.1 hypothetical protein AOBTE_LOCUS27073 [Acanthoscelides obtectus]CAK1669566.1 hypothetical protein AOBTE_LOCUS27074 [Acanthoscelides obtectus]
MMCKLFVIFAIVAISSCSADPEPKAKPGFLAAPAAVVTATSHQSFVRGYSAPLVAAPAVAYTAPYAAAYAAPYVAAAAPIAYL